MNNSKWLVPSSKRAFSLIEILVVMGIIAFLTAAIVVVIPRVANSAKIAATRATIKTVDEQLNDRINGFRRWINNQDQMAGNNGVPSYVTLQGTMSLASNNIAVAKVLAVKQLFRSAFPQQFSDLTTPPTYNAANHKASTESAACLYIILTQQALFDTEPPSTADLKGLQLADTDNDGLMEIVDAWGHPVRFYRWPTRLTRPSYSPNATPPAPSGFCEVLPSPLTLSMGGAAPRMPLRAWKANTTYSVGTMIAPTNAAQLMSFSVTYQCTGGGTSSGSQPNWPTPVIVGQTINDGTVTWQAVLDPLSVDPDDPLGLVYQLNSGLITEPTETPNTWNNPLIVSCGPDEILGLFEPSAAAWQANTAYAVGASVVPTSANGHIYACTTGGTSGGGQPSWPTTQGATVTDGTVVWTTDIGSTLALPLPDPTDTATGFLRSAMYDNITNHQ